MRTTTRRRAPSVTLGSHRNDDAAPGRLAAALFDKLLPAASWRPWRAWFLASLGYPLAAEALATYQACTGRATAPTTAPSESWLVVGRRSGKSRVTALMVLYLAAMRRWRVAAGEVPVVMLVTPARRQASVVLNYIRGFLADVPSVTITRETQDTIELSTGVQIMITTASFKTPRGFSVVGLVLDEIAFLPDDSGTLSDREIVRAIKPALVASDGLLVALSSPYARRGLLFERYDRHFARDGSDVLVWQAASTTMNPTIAAEAVAKEYADDPASAAAEWGGEFRGDLEALFSVDAVRACVVPGRYELPPVPGLGYVACLDPSGGSADSFTLAIAHRDPDGTPVLDCLREVRPPFSPEQACTEFAAVLQRYACAAVFSDAYAGEWPREQFRKHGVTVQRCPLTRSELYLELLPIVNSGRCALLDVPTAVSQLHRLDRRVGRSGKDAVDHPEGQHDDLANALAGAIVMVGRAVGLLAPLPVQFDQCVNYDAYAARVCCLLGRGPHLPQDAHCRRECVGFQTVSAAWRRHTQTLTPDAPFPTHAAFLRDHFELNDFASRFAHQRAIDRLGL